MYAVDYAENPFPDYNSNMKLLEPEGCIRFKHWEIIIETIDQYLDDLTDFLTSSNCKDSTVYMGYPGICYTLFKTGDYFNKFDASLSEFAVSTSLNYLQQKLPKEPTTKPSNNCSFLTGDVGSMCILAYFYSSHNLLQKSYAWLDIVTKYKDYVCDSSRTSIPNEVLTGRSGYLYSMLFLYHNLIDVAPNIDYIDQICNSIIQTGHLHSLDIDSNCYFKRGENLFCGVQKGICGVLYHLLDPISITAPSVVKVLKNIKYTADSVFSRINEGNLPVTMTDTEESPVNWCNGVSGAIYLAIRCHRVFKEKKYLLVAEKFCKLIWKKGLCRNNLSLCHGISGNAYAFLALYNYTSNQKYLYYAIKFAHWIITHPQNLADSTYSQSLYHGKAGILYFLLDLHVPSQAKFPGFQALIDERN